MVRVTQNKYRTLNWSNTLQYSMKVGTHHSFDFLAGQEIYERKYKSNTTEVRFLPLGITAESALARCLSPLIRFNFPPAVHEFCSAPAESCPFGRLTYYQEILVRLACGLQIRKFSYDNGILFPSVYRREISKKISCILSVSRTLRSARYGTQG